MVAGNGSESAPVNRTTLERVSDREIVITRAFDGPARIVFDAWTKPELLQRWWAPRSLGVEPTGQHDSSWISRVSLQKSAGLACLRLPAHKKRADFG